MLGGVAVVVIASQLFAYSARAESGKEWTTYGGDLANTRYSTLNLINTKNVKSLKVAWAFPLGVLEGQETTPVIVDGTMYVTSPRGPKYVFALDAKTGAVKWRYAPEMPADIASAVCCGLVNRGVAYANGKVFVGRLDGMLVALDASNGKELWKAKVADYKAGDDITSPPTVVKNMVVIGYAGGEYATRGAITAFDQETGKEVWRTHTIPGPEEPGHDSWPSSDMAMRGGAAAWLVGSYDPQLNLIYYGTSNPAPWAAHARGTDNSNYGKYTNLHSSSTLALNADTGKIVWAFQQTPYDAWDYDGVNEKVLTDLTIGGSTVQALMTADRNGFFYVLDRKTGKLVSAAPYVHVNWAKGLDANGRPIEDPDKRPRKDIWARDVCPSFYGGKNFPPVSYSAQTHFVYIPTFNICMDEVGRDVGEPKKGIFFLGTEFDAGKYGPGGNGGEFVAWDPVEKKKVWGVKEPKPFLGGALSTAGGLVFYGNMDGELKGLDAKSGDVLWRFQTGSGINQGPVTYEVGGKQYLAIASGRLVGPPSFMGETGKKLLSATVEGATLFVFELPD
jgi:PQQ-dependent dehydrogenase (methanol/ethanol family)